jgi:hypothetical protein
MKYTQLLIAFSFLFFAAGCGKAPSSRSLSSLECVDNNCGSGGSSFAVHVQKTEGVISQRQLLPNYEKCLNIPSSSISATTKAMFAQSQASLSQDGIVGDINAPMLMAIAKVASEICLDLVNIEKNSGSRKYFPGFTLSGNASVDNSQTFNMTTTLNSFGNNCWGRSLNSAELNLLLSKIGSGKDQSAAIFACTAILSSAEAIRF